MKRETERERIERERLSSEGETERTERERGDEIEIDKRLRKKKETSYLRLGL